MVVQKTEFDEVFEGLTEFGVSTQSELARLLGIEQPTVSDAKSRGKFPLKWARLIASHYKISIDSLYARKGEKKAKSKVDPAASELVDLRQSDIKKLEVAVADKQKIIELLEKANGKLEAEVLSLNEENALLRQKAGQASK